jgi:WD40 repeat protein
MAAPNDVVQYSEPHSQSGGLVKFSPDGRWVASAANYRLVLREVDTLQIVQLYSCVDAIEALEWSSDSEYVLCSIYKRGAAQVWSVRDKEWHCKIDEGPVGLAHARFSPDGRHVLATADFRLRITIWSLCDRSVFYIRFPKHVGKALDFTPDGSLMALAARPDGRDSIGLFDPNGWKPVRTFPCASVDLEDLKWSPSGKVLCVVDSVLQYQVLIYDQMGTLLQSYRPYDHALGVKALAWHPQGHMLAIGSYDERARLLNSLTWQRLAECTHPPTLRPAFSEDAVVWIEPAGGGGYDARRLPADVPSVRPDPDVPSPAVGVGHVEWSHGGRYLATRNDNMPTALWIWDGDSLLLHSLLLQANAVRCAAWHPRQQLLALCTSSSAVFLWSARGCRTAPLPVSHELSVRTLQWSATGDALLLLDDDRYCVCFLSLPADDDAGEEDEALGVGGAPRLGAADVAAESAYEAAADDADEVLGM